MYLDSRLCDFSTHLSIIRLKYVIVGLGCIWKRRPRTHTYKWDKSGRQVAQCLYGIYGFVRCIQCSCKSLAIQNVHVSHPTTWHSQALLSKITEYKHYANNHVTIWILKFLLFHTMATEFSRVQGVQAFRGSFIYNYTTQGCTTKCKKIITV